MRVLLVDDDDLVRETLTAYLEDEEMMVVAVGSAEEAIEHIRAGDSFDVSIMDIRLPGLDGNDAIRQISATTPDLRFLVHTGSVDYQPPPDLVAQGLTEERIFIKPVLDLSILAAALRNLLSI